MIVGAETVCAVKAFPQMDDAYLLLLLKERGAGALAAAHRDRPLVGALWQKLAEVSGASFWSVAFVAHFVLWLALGVLSCRLWRRLFPEWERYAVVVGAIVVAPIVVRTQFSTVTISLLGVLSVVAAWAAVLLAWRFADAGRAGVLVLRLRSRRCRGAVERVRCRGRGRGRRSSCARAAGSDSDRRARARWSAAGLGALTIACYFAYVRVGNFAARPLVDPTRQLGRMDLVTRTPFHFMTRFWDAVFGDLFRSAAAMQLEWQSKSTLLAVLFGALVGAGLWLAAGPGAAPSLRKGSRRNGVAALAVALGAGLLPIALMRPVFRSAFASRFEIPVLPIAASLSVALVLALTQVRFHRLVAAGLGFVVGIATVREASEALRQRSAMASAAGLLESVVRSHPGVTQAVLSEPGLCYTAQVCTGAITRDWAPEIGRKLWVETPDEARMSLGKPGRLLGDRPRRGFRSEASSGRRCPGRRSGSNWAIGRRASKAIVWRAADGGKAMSLAGARVLVTGGAGFIGSHLVDALVALGARVRVLDNLSGGRLENLEPSRDRIEFLEGDIRDPRSCAAACEGASVVFHQAALGSVPRSIADPATSIAVNVGGTANVFSRPRGTRASGGSSMRPRPASTATAPRCRRGKGRRGDRFLPTPCPSG